MKILIINKSDTIGGAAVAARRLKDALQANGHNVKMLVQEKLSDDKYIYSTTQNKSKKYYNFLLFIIERLYFLFFEKSKSIRFAFSPAIAGENIVKHPLVQDADIIHLHWFNQGFLSLKSLKNLLKLDKKIVWTLHDMWAFTGGCHYSGECTNYQSNCGSCKFLKKPGKNDLSTKIWRKKREIFQNKDIQFVTCSSWLAKMAGKSSLLRNFNIQAIPNPIDTQKFYPKDKAEIRAKLNLPLDKKLILFGAANIMDERKGLKYLINALEKLKVKFPELIDQIELLLFGKSNPEFIEKLPLKVNNLGILKDEEKIAEAYISADAFVLPSLEDNLPNTIMESMACGTPVVAFNVGGIPEMIDHKKSGYLAEYKSIEDLMDGLVYVLQHQNYSLLGENACNKVEKLYEQKPVSNRYALIYNKF